MDKRRLHPGAVARVVYSFDPSLIGTIVIVEEWLVAYDCWGVMLTSREVTGRTLATGRLTTTRRAAARDSSLEPIFPDHQDMLSEQREVAYD